MMKTKWISTVAVVGVIAAFGLGRFTAGDVAHDHAHGHGHGTAVSEEEASEWTCPMHPQIRSDKFDTCPICHMDLVPVSQMGGGGGDTAVQMSEGARRMARVQNGEVESGVIADELKVFGMVEINESAEVDLTAWTGGRIERLFVSAVGEKVRRGQLLARIYSPELLAAQRSLIQAKQILEEVQGEGGERRARAARASLEAARTELRLLGMDAKQLEEIEKSKEVRETVDIYATASGTIRQKLVSEGDYIEKGGRILSLAALESVWAQLEIYERDLARISVGQPVSVEIPALGGEVRQGRVDFISPDIDRAKRVARARVILSNEDGQLRPGMYVNGLIEIGVGDEETLSVPRSAVLWTGERSLVYRYDRGLEPPGYVPQQVKIGPRVGDRFIIEEGLEAGDEIAVKGAFRIDATLQIQGGPTMMSAMHAQPEDHSPVEVTAEGTEFDPPISPARIPDGAWYCDMGTTHWAQAEKGDGTCPVCGMFLTEKEGGEGHDHHDHDHHDHDHHGEEKGGEHVH